MRNSELIVAAPAAFVMLWAFACPIGDVRALEAKGAVSPGAVVLWDTVRHSTESLGADAIEKKDGWKEVSDGNISGDPLLFGEDFALQTGSPCIDAGDPAVLDSGGGRSDIGATGGAFGHA